MSRSPAVPPEARLAARRRPQGRAVMHQRWSDLLFLHWRLDPDEVQARLPEGLRVDTFDGSAWVGIVPFTMSRIRPSFLPPIPGLSAFPELNLRTYAVDDDGVPGVWFFSLEAGQSLAVRVARRFFHLPYFRADMAVVRDAGDGSVHYASHRRGSDEALASRFRYRLDPRGAPATTGTAEFFLVERYVLFAQRARDGALRRGRVHHPPYELVAADVAEHDARLFRLDGLAEPRRPPDHVCGARPVDVEIFPLEAIRA